LSLDDILALPPQVILVFNTNPAVPSTALMPNR
jgi:hypothetical protein